MDISKIQKEKLLILFRYYSPQCKFTGDPDAMEEILRKFRAGSMNDYSLNQEVEHIQEQYEFLKKEDFADNYTEEYINNPDPITDFEQYMMSKDIDELMYKMDQLIYYKKKMIKLGKRDPDEPRVYINKLFLGLSHNGPPSLSYRNTIFYQR